MARGPAPHGRRDAEAPPESLPHDDARAVRGRRPKARREDPFARAASDHRRDGPDRGNGRGRAHQHRADARPEDRLPHLPSQALPLPGRSPRPRCHPRVRAPRRRSRGPDRERPLGEGLRVGARDHRARQRDGREVLRPVPADDARGPSRSGPDRRHGKGRLHRGEPWPADAGGRPARGASGDDAARYRYELAARSELGRRARRGSTPPAPLAQGSAQQILVRVPAGFAKTVYVQFNQVG